MKFSVQTRHLAVKTIAATAMALSLGACASMVETSPSSASSAQGTDDILASVMRGESRMQGAELERAVKKASAYPLGSAENPVRAHMPQGQRAYLSRLRCSDTSRPSFGRAGNLGPGVYGNIVDLYIVSCASGEPESAEIIMDMYHTGHVEAEAVEGFGIMPAR